jgi:Domain of unknown function (DUF4262)
MGDFCSETVEDQLGHLRIAVQGFGFAIIATDGQVPWLYTVGLTDRLHPELVVAGIRIETARELITRLGERVLAGERLRAGTVVEESGDTFGLVEVHQSRLAAGLCATWKAYHQATPGPGRLSALQVAIPDEWFCRCHAGAQPRLDLPGGVPGTPKRERRRRRRRHTRAVT